MPPWSSKSASTPCLHGITYISTGFICIPFIWNKDSKNNSLPDMAANHPAYPLLFSTYIIFATIMPIHKMICGPGIDRYRILIIYGTPPKPNVSLDIRPAFNMISVHASIILVRKVSFWYGVFVLSVYCVKMNNFDRMHKCITTWLPFPHSFLAFCLGNFPVAGGFFQATVCFWHANWCFFTSMLFTNHSII